MKSDEFDSQVIDVPGLMAHIDSDVSILNELLEIFDGYYPTQLDQLRDAIDSGDCGEIREIAHQFKGAVSNFYGCSVIEVARAIEDASRDNCLDVVKIEFDRLEPEVIRLVENLRQVGQRKP